MIKEWIFERVNTNEKSLVKRLLYNRGIIDSKDVNEFLNPLTMDLTSPFVFQDMEKSVERIIYSIENNETIMIYGDFDADGVTSTAVLYKTLRYLNANVEYYIPNREVEGHGMSTKSLIKIMTKVKPKLLITVDCGISDVEEVKFINSFRTMDVIITDHHEAPEVLPPAFAIINPKASNSLNESLSARQIENLTYLAGCGVAFKVAQALLLRYSKTEFIYEILPLVAIGTISDIVPLLGENRYFVSKGLQLISQGRHEGITMLLASAGYDITKGITAENIAFGVSPRINASGRLDTVDSALKVLISENLQEIKMAVTTLNELNKVRQTLCKETFAQANEIYKQTGTKDPAIVLANSDWHIGIIGIVASKFVEKYYKPAFLMNYDKEKGEYRCSARSIDGIPLYEVLCANSELFDGFGGHTLAAGLSFNEDVASFEDVKKALNETVKTYIKDKIMKPSIRIDLEVLPNDISLDLIEDISKLEPFGASNPSPILAMKGLSVKQVKTMGTDNAHLRIILEKDGLEFTAVWWQMGHINLEKGENVDIAFHPQINEFNGNVSIQLIVDDVHAKSLEKKEICKYKIYDNRKKSGIFSQVNDYIKKSNLDIKIFAESKPILDSLKPYEQIYARIFARNDIPKCDVLMFYDYPADSYSLEYILSSAQPKKVHFMKYEPKILDPDELIKIFTGMLKFSIHNTSGKIDLIRCASFLGKSPKILEELIDLYAVCDVISVVEKNPQSYIVEEKDFNNIVEIKENEEYDYIFEKSRECELFQNKLLNGNLSEILSDY